MSEAATERESEISRLLMEGTVDLRALRKISRLEGGFMSNQIRARVWPKLLGINRFDIPDYRSFIDPHTWRGRCGEWTKRRTGEKHTEKTDDKLCAISSWQYCAETVTYTTTRYTLFACATIFLVLAAHSALLFP
jgi:hypothetical protein